MYYQSKSRSHNNHNIHNQYFCHILVGRTGRFGAFGKALALCYTESEKLKLSEHQSELKFAIFLVEKVEELNSIEKYSKTAQNVQKYRQLKGMKEPLTLQDSLLKNWKEIFLECMAKPRPEDNDWKYLKHGSFRNGLELHEGRRFREEVEGDFQKALEKQRKRRLNLEDDENPSNEEDSCKAGNGQWSDSSVDEDSEENDSVDDSDNDDTELL
jgi:superfamily II DNA/RNA helicase